jgi:predicted ester cyclase
MVTTERAPDTERTTNQQLEANKGVVRRFIVEIFGQQNLDAVDELASEDFTPHTWGTMPPGRKPLREATERAGKGVTDATFEIHDLVAEGDLVAARLTSSAIHSGEFMGLKPTNRRYQIDEMHFFRLRDGQVVEHWHEFDKAGLMRQLSGDPSA